MPGKDNLFSQAENDRYDVSNVLSDKAYGTTKPNVQPVPEETAPEINLEEGAPFLDSIDPEATIGEYMERYEEEAQEDIEEAQAEPVSPATEDVVSEVPKEGLQNAAIRQQAEKARASFIDDIQSIRNEPDAKPSSIRAPKDEPLEDITLEEENNTMAYDETDTQPVESQDFYEETYEVEDDDDGPEPVTFKDLLKPAARRIKKPRFVQSTGQEDDETPIDDSAQAPKAKEETYEEPESDHIMQDYEDFDDEDTEEINELDEALAEARAAQKKGHSICEDLHHLQHILEEGRSPLLHKTEVLVPRERTLRLVRALTAICEVDPSYIDSASEDKLIDRLVSENSDDDYRPLERARSRAQAIIQNATKQADTIIGDAKTLARQLLAETEAEIKDKFDAADEQIAVRMTTTKEESTKKLNEARSELTTSKQRSVEILSKYLEKAENDYQGYWERAENTVMASLEQSDSILGKAAEIYRKELIAIHQDKEELDEILDHLKKYKKRTR